MYQDHTKINIKTLRESVAYALKTCVSVAMIQMFSNYTYLLV